MLWMLHMLLGWHELEVNHILLRLSSASSSASESVKFAELGMMKRLALAMLLVWGLEMST